MFSDTIYYTIVFLKKQSCCYVFFLQARLATIRYN